MFSRKFLSSTCSGLRVAACAMTLLAVTVAAQDSDDDGVLPKYGDPGASVPESVGVSTPAPGVDALDASKASLAISHLGGPTVLDMTVAPSDAMFVASGPVDFTYTDTFVGLQGDGLLTLPPGYSVEFHAAPVAAGRVALLVVHAADASLAEILAGNVVPTAVVPVGDVGAIDLAMVQGVVNHHADMLSGYAVSVVFVSVDAQWAPHVSAARFATDGEPIEVLID